MKRILFILLAATALAFTTGCTKTDYNGPLDGYWRLMRIEQTDGTLIAEPESSFWAFQLNTCMLYIDLNYISRMYSCFEYNGSTLRMYKMYKASKQVTANDKDELIETMDDATEKAKYDDLLKQGGLYSYDEHFDIECLNSKKMVLKSSDKRLHFIRY